MCIKKTEFIIKTFPPKKTKGQEGFTGEFY